MTRDWKYILYIGLALGAFVLLKLLSPKQHNWTVTYAAEDKNPFGGFALHTLMRTLSPERPVSHSFKTLYELKDSIKHGSGVFIVAGTFSPGKEDAEMLLDHVNEGGSAFISAQYLYGALADTLKLQTYDTNFKFGDVLSGSDSSYLHFVATPLDTVRRFFFKQANIHNYISNFDTTRTTVIAVNEYRAPVTIRMRWGKGSIIVNSTPMAFTNIYLLAAGNAPFVSTQFSYLPDTPVTWTEYYQRGRREVATPLRFILQNESLRWAYYMSIIGLLIFMGFEIKRRQRIIPVIPPLPNTTLEFVSTIGDLYYQNGDHKNIAEKKINYFLEQVRSRHGLATNQLDTAFASALARKAGTSEDEAIQLVRQIKLIKEQAGISADELIAFNSKLETFNAKA